MIYTKWHTLMTSLWHILQMTILISLSDLFYPNHAHTSDVPPFLGTSFSSFTWAGACSVSEFCRVFRSVTPLHACFCYSTTLHFNLSDPAVAFAALVI